MIFFVYFIGLVLTGAWLGYVREKGHFKFLEPSEFNSEGVGIPSFFIALFWPVTLWPFLGIYVAKEVSK